jgi:integrase
LTEREGPKFLHRLVRCEGDPATCFALELLMLTAVRPGELRGARWSEIDMKRALWRIPAERMKMATEHVVPLARQRVQLLQRMQQLSGDHELIFPLPFYPGKPLSGGTDLARNDQGLPPNRQLWSTRWSNAVRPRRDWHAAVHPP